VDDKTVSFTICDVGNMCVFAHASEFGITGAETAKEIDANTTLIAHIKELRGKAAQLVGMCKSWEAVDEESAMIPMVVLVSKPSSPEAHVQSRLFLDNRCHTAMAGTGAICTTACSRIRGSVVQQYLTEAGMKSETYEIKHPSGVMPVIVQAEQIADSPEPKFKTLSFIRTSRRILDGRLYVPDDVRSDVFGQAISQNGTNGSIHHVSNTAHEPNGTSDKSISDSTKPSVTNRITNFVAQTQFQDLEKEHVALLKMFILDFIGVAAGATVHSPSSKPFLEAIQTFTGSSTGYSTVIAQGKKARAPYAALLNGAGAHSLDFDDTHAGGALHPGVSVVSVAFAEAETSNIKSSEELFTALAVGYEVSCRIGMALGPGGHARGFHNTSTAGIFGAIATISKLRGSTCSTIESAFGLALSRASGTMQYLANGSWNKRLHPGFAAHDAFLCLALAEAGAIGAIEPIEGKFGLLNLFSSTPNASILEKPFGSEWVFLETSIKPYPACRMTHTAIELASEVSERNKDRSVKKITIKCPKRFYPIVGEASKRKMQPENDVDAQFSIYFQTAIAWIYGKSLGQAAYKHLQDPVVLDLIQTMVVEVDESYQRLETGIIIEWEGGQVGKWELKAPRGEPGNPISWESALEKFLSLAIPIYGKGKAMGISNTILHFEKHNVKDLTDLYG
jgi:2-methylcitrate dehydratase PrpD